jgi:hypothetical protein
MCEEIQWEIKSCTSAKCMNEDASLLTLYKKGSNESQTQCRIGFNTA